MIFANPCGHLPLLLNFKAGFPRGQRPHGAVHPSPYQARDRLIAPNACRERFQTVPYKAFRLPTRSRFGEGRPPLVSLRNGFFQNGSSIYMYFYNYYNNSTFLLTIRSLFDICQILFLLTWEKRLCLNPSNRTRYPNIL